MKLAKKLTFQNHICLLVVDYTIFLLNNIIYFIVLYIITLLIKLSTAATQNLLTDCIKKEKNCKVMVYST